MVRNVDEFFLSTISANPRNSPDSSKVLIIFMFQTWCLSSVLLRVFTGIITKYPTDYIQLSLMQKSSWNVTLAVHNCHTSPITKCRHKNCPRPSMSILTFTLHHVILPLVLMASLHILCYLTNQTSKPNHPPSNQSLPQEKWKKLARESPGYEFGVGFNSSQLKFNDRPWTVFLFTFSLSLRLISARWKSFKPFFQLIWKHN